MCGPVVPWDWFIVDTSYVLVLIGGAMIFRAKQVALVTWMSFGALSVVVGALLFFFTYDAQAAFAEAQGGVSAVLNAGTSC